STSLVVSQAATSTTVTVHAHDLSATVTPVAPGTGTPTGTVTFAVGGVPVGTATLSGGTATLTYTVPTGRANTVAAAYNGDTDFAASSVSTTRRDPLITAHVQSSSPRSSYGWYHAAVTVTFTCTPQGAALTTPCPVAVTLTHDGAGQSVSGTIMAADGGAATASVTGIDIDTVRPRVSIAGVRNGATYPSAPRARCSASDTLSGVARCTLTSSVRNGRTTYRATAVDKAGNTATATVTVTVQGYALAGAPFVDGAFTVHVGHAYTLVVQGVSVQPHFYDAAVVPARPTKRDQAFHAAGRNRWTLGVYMQRALRSHPYWYLGVLVGRTMHLVKIRIAP
ncbi:MAG: Ig-like domain-containing protein, partial [Jatrophihabitans sp.]|uniref:Ig-like domain-containing protein n=1 Tax=Jatrophihabitans sp. TaxID=1932789 RepID=UPI003F80D858